ncbi:hypothetical protein [Rhizobium sp. OAE497]|uniref:hypothetical protein n=1 Tax=Rhizobium sp. OAE497 TaxID=2663796 RepID=UPI0018F4AACE
MSQADDDLLMREINNQADLAEKALPDHASISTIAAVLAAHFDHRTEEDIAEQLRTVWRSRGLYWNE